MDILITTNTGIKDGASLVRTAQLYRGEIHFLPTTSSTRMLSESLCLLILCRQCLNS